MRSYIYRPSLLLSDAALTTAVPEAAGGVAINCDKIGRAHV